MIELKQSPVIFDEETHSYRLDDNRLLGITGLIHSILGLGVYPDANDYVKDYAIPRAGSRGTAVHHAIQTYDQLGIRQTTQTVRTRYGCNERLNLRYEDETWDVTNELDAYIRHLENFVPIANELTVSDNKRYASQIDNVWQYKETGGIWLVDTKTNNVKFYPTCGYFNSNYFANGEEALKEYLSWQLSIYAELFEAENPGLKVEGLACNWLRENEDEFWIIDRKPSELVWALLETDYFLSANGPVYFHPDPSIFGVRSETTPPSLPIENDVTPIIPPHMIDFLAEKLKRYQDAKSEYEDAKETIERIMREHGIKSYDFGPFKATIAADSETKTFDSKRFKADHADLYSDYITSKLKKGGLTVKIK